VVGRSNKLERREIGRLRARPIIKRLPLPLLEGERLRRDREVNIKKSPASISGGERWGEKRSLILIRVRVPFLVDNKKAPASLVEVGP